MIANLEKMESGVVVLDEQHNARLRRRRRRLVDVSCRS